MALSIDPNTKAIINGVVTVCGVIGQIGVTAFPAYIPAGIATDIVQTASLIFMIYGGMNTAGNLLSSNKSGALAPADPPSIAAARKVVDLTPDDSAAKIAQVKAAAVQAIQSRTPSAGPA